MQNLGYCKLLVDTISTVVNFGLKIRGRWPSYAIRLIVIVFVTFYQSSVSATANAENNEINFRWTSINTDEIHAGGNNITYSIREGILKYRKVATISFMSGIQQIDSSPTTPLTIKYGTWRFSNKRECGAEFWCRTITFSPNSHAINVTPAGKTISSFFIVKRIVNGETVETKQLRMKIFGLPELSSNMLPNSEKRFNIVSYANSNSVSISTDGSAFQSPYLEGSISLFQNKSYELELFAREIVGSGTPVVGIEGSAATRDIKGQSISVKSYGTNFTYGTWYLENSILNPITNGIRSGTHRIWFKINNNNLRNLAVGSSVRYLYYVRIKNSSGENAVTQQTFTITITRDYPIATLSFVNESASSNPVDEGENVEIKVTLDPPPVVNTEVSLVQTETGLGRGFVGTFSPHPVIVSTNGFATTTLTTSLVNSHILDGQINISVADNPKLTSTNTSLPIVVKNYMYPTISISSDLDGETIEEGENITFKLVAFPKPTKDIEIELSISELKVVSGFLKEFSTSPVIGPSGILELTISTNVITNHKNDGKINVGIVSNPYYQVDQHFDMISVAISNSVNPVISIINVPTRITEGNAFSFKIQATPAPETPLMIAFDVADASPNDQYIRQISVPTPVEMTTSGVVNVIVETNELLATASAGQITISITGGKRYKPSIENGTASVVVTKNSLSTISEVSVSFNGQQNKISEGEDLVFTFSANPIPRRPLYVNFEVEETGMTKGYFKSDSIENPVTIGTNGETTITIPTLKRSANEANGELTVSILENPTYSISESDSGIVVVVENLSIPVVTIESSYRDGIVVEGGSYMFTLNALPLPETPLELDIEIVDGGTGHFGGTTPPAPFIIPTSGSKQVILAVNDITSTVEHGHIDIRINPPTDDSYSVDETLGRMTTKIKDLVLPKISITRNEIYEEVVEGSSFIVRLAANPMPIQPISVGLNVQNTATGQFSGLPTGNTVTIGEDGVLEIPVDTINVTSSYQEPNQVTIAIRTVVMQVILHQ